MKRFLLVIIFLLILFVDQEVVATPPTHFLMVLQWSRSFCKQRILANSTVKCPKDYEEQLGAKFYVHGLWPKPGLERLISDEYDFQVMYKLAANDRNRLMTNWRSALVDVKGLGKEREGAAFASCSDLWAHEWKLHGQNQSLKHQKEYFLSALDIYDSLSGIHRDVVSLFHPKPEAAEVIVSDIVKHIELKHKVKVDISCLPYGVPGKKMLYELYFNMTMTGQLQNITDPSGLHGDPCPVKGKGKVVFI